eukprot:1188456-Prorocentrum_minimum.AAC.2
MNESEDCIYLRAQRVLTNSPVTPTKLITNKKHQGRFERFGGKMACSGLPVSYWSVMRIYPYFLRLIGPSRPCSVVGAPF